MKGVIKPYRNMLGIYLIELETGNMRLATQNLVPGKTVYGEQLVKIDGKEYRLWDPYRSKLAAAFLNGLSTMPLKDSGSVLYLGAASGTTVSHVSDIVGLNGRVYALEFSPRSMRELLNKLVSRMNVFPILADARFPWSYSLIMEKVDTVYCDIAQPEQAQIFADNTDLFLKNEGLALLIIKARSIDSAKSSEKIFKEELHRLKRRKLNVRRIIPLEPYDRDHILVLTEK